MIFPPFLENYFAEVKIKLKLKTITDHGDVPREDYFVEDLMSDMPADPRCSLFADYILKNYVASNSKFPPNLWAQLSSLDSKRTTNATESFHAHYNVQFYAAHPTIFAFLDVITKIQIRPKKKCVFTVTRPTLIFASDPMNFYTEFG
jgi:hypothetical protein